jgi:hypothetical protein
MMYGCDTCISVCFCFWPLANNDVVMYALIIFRRIFANLPLPVGLNILDTALILVSAYYIFTASARTFPRFHCLIYLQFVTTPQLYSNVPLHVFVHRTPAYSTARFTAVNPEPRILSQACARIQNRHNSSKGPEMFGSRNQLAGTNRNDSVFFHVHGPPNFHLDLRVVVWPSGWFYLGPR